MFLLRETDRRVTDICFDVGFTSLGTFSRTFHESWASRRPPIARGTGRSSRPIASRSRRCGRGKGPETRRWSAVLEKPIRATVVG